LYTATLNESRTIFVGDSQAAYSSTAAGEDHRGGNVANTRFALLTLALALTFCVVQANSQTFADPQPNPATTFTGSALTCSQPQKLLIPRPFAERAKLKAKLSNLLRESLYDDAKGIVNIAREKEIRALANKLKKER
jgi:hypothetical protein